MIIGPPKTAIIRDESGVLHVGPLSGGKDSTAMALGLRERFPERPFIWVCTPTGDELPDMVAHWVRLGSILGSQLWPITGGQSLDGLIRQYNALPNWRQRWCTRQIKIEPFAVWLAEQAKLGPVTTYVGLRADEPEREGGDYSDVPGVAMTFPMREWGWGIQDVLDRLEMARIKMPFRTDCARCYHQTLFEWFCLWRDYPEIYADAERQEQETGYTFRSPSRDTWPASLIELRACFAAGRIPTQRKRQTRCRVCVQ